MTGVDFLGLFWGERTGSAISWTVGRAAAERGATLPSVATAQVAEPAPKYNSSQPNVTYGSTSVQWSGPSLYDYALGCNLGDRTAGELSGTAIREDAKKRSEERRVGKEGRSSWAP